MNRRWPFAVLFGSYLLGWLGACIVWPVEATPQEIGAIVEREYGVVLDRGANTSDLSESIQDMVRQKNLRELVAAERRWLCEERWLQRLLGTFFCGTGLAVASILVLRWRIPAARAMP